MEMECADEWVLFSVGFVAWDEGSSRILVIVVVLVLCTI